MLSMVEIVGVANLMNQPHYAVTRIVVCLIVEGMHVIVVVCTISQTVIPSSHSVRIVRKRGSGEQGDADDNRADHHH